MGLSVVNYTAGDDTGWGVLRDGAIYPLQGDYADHRAVMNTYFDRREQFDTAIGDAPIDAAAVAFNAPITRDVQLFCQGLNYVAHREESGASTEHAEENLVFMKAASSICGPQDAILRPRGCQLLDYEIELGLVMKRAIGEPTTVTESDLPDYLGALVLCNDVSARDLMFGAPMLQWFKGKSQRTFCPTGPVLYLMDDSDFARLYELELHLTLNGETRQQATTEQLIHRPAQTLTEISGFANIAAGDCLLTGTPGGILAGGNLKVALSIFLNFNNDAKRREKFTRAQLARSSFLQPGDVLELSIRSPDGAIDLGRQRNEIADAP